MNNNRVKEYIIVDRQNIMDRKRVIRNVVRGLIIGGSSTLAFFLVIFITFYIQHRTLEFSDLLKGYELTPITGQPIEMTQEEYDESISTFDNFIYSPVYFFPETISSENSFFLYYENAKREYHSDVSRYEVYLLCKWTEEEFNNEKTRLMCTVAQSRDSSTVYSEDLFPLPAFVYLYNHGSEFEYVLLDEINHEIRYISFCEIGNKNNIVFGLKYAPQKTLYQATYIYVNTDDKCDCS